MTESMVRQSFSGGFGRRSPELTPKVHHDHRVICMHKGSRGDRNGFTLIEVVIAVAIMGIGLTVIMELFSGGLRLARISEEYTKAMNYASLRLEEIATQKTVEEGEEEGEFDQTFRWRVGIEKVDILGGDHGTEFKPPATLYHIRLLVLWQSGSKERSASLETYKTVKSGIDEKKS